MSFFTTNSLAKAVLAASLVSLAHAQATRTWISGTGDDVNPCSRTAPCKTFAGAIPKTAASGEISVLDPGGFGALTITKAITISGDGTLAGILSSGTGGIIVNAGPNDVVTVRNVSIVGANPAAHGIRFLAGRQLNIDNVTLSGFAANSIDVALSGSGNLAVKDTTITGGAAGLRIASTSGRVNASLDHVSIRGAVTGIDNAFANSFVVVSDSNITFNSGFGVLVEAGEVNLESCLLNMNNVGAQANTGALLRLSNSTLYDNLTSFGCGGGTIASAGNNRRGNNTGGTVPACMPTATVNLQ